MFSSLSEWLHYIESIHYKVIDLNLDRMKPLAQSLEVDHFPCPVIMIGGTNGKGSCVHALENIYLAAGFRVGTYTSPHLLRFNERLRINGIDVSDDALIQAFVRVEKARGKTPLSFFEFTTLAILLLLKEAALDVIVLEVGLGGRLDAVNCVGPDITVITSVSIDHTDWLGPDRESIGREKAGIFRPGKPVVCGDLAPPQTILTAAKELAAPLYCYQRDFFTVLSAGDREWRWVGHDREYSHLPIPLLDLDNVASSVMVVELLQDKLAVSEQAIKKALGKMKLAGRYETVKHKVPCILDVAHNPASMQRLARKLQQDDISGKTMAVVGMLKDKPIKESLQAMVPVIDQWIVADLSDLPRGATTSDLTNILTELTMSNWQACSSVAAALERALQECREDMNNRVVIFGSFHTVAQAKQFFDE